MANDNRYPSDEDYFSSTRMTFGDHIEVLRLHLFRAIAGFVIALIASFGIGWWVLQGIQAPAREQLKAYYNEHKQRELEELKDRYPQMFDLQEIEIVIEPAQLNARFIPKEPDNAAPIILVAKMPPNPEALERQLELINDRFSRLIALSFHEVLLVFLQVCIVTGLVIGSPWIFYQIWAFIAEGLYPHEKRMVNVYLPVSVALFIAGVLFCYFIVLPRGLEAMLFFNRWMDVPPQIRLSEWLGFAIWVPVVFGLSFELPLFMFALERLGIGSIESYQKFRKYAWFGMAVGAAFLTPIDPYTMIFMWLPMCGFYELAIVFCKMFPRRSLFDLDVPESDEMIEV